MRTFWLRSLKCRSGEPDSPASSSPPKIGLSKSMREIILDTETTGLDPFAATGWSRSAASRSTTACRLARRSTSTSIRSATCRRRPSRSMACRPNSSPASLLFHEVVEEFLAFIADAPLVIHNASLRHQLHQRRARADQAPGGRPRERLVDTLLLARRKHPGVSNRLDDLLLALFDRQFPPHQARRAARRRDCWPKCIST